jgi:hypothetical protein
MAGLEGDIYDEIVITVNEPVCDDLLIYNSVMGRFFNPMITSDIDGRTGGKTGLLCEYLRCGAFGIRVAPVQRSRGVDCMIPLQ